MDKNLFSLASARRSSRYRAIILLLAALIIAPAAVSFVDCERPVWMENLEELSENSKKTESEGDCVEDMDDFVHRLLALSDLNTVSTANSIPSALLIKEEPHHIEVLSPPPELIS